MCPTERIRGKPRQSQTSNLSILDITDPRKRRTQNIHLIKKGQSMSEVSEQLFTPSSVEERRYHRPIVQDRLHPKP